MTYTCKCEDEHYKNNCSNECDLCEFGHSDAKRCFCIDCQIDAVEEQESKDFVQIVDIHQDSIYVLKEDYDKTPYDFLDGTTMEVRYKIQLPVCPLCRVQPALERVFACETCEKES